MTCARDMWLSLVTHTVVRHWKHGGQRTALRARTAQPPAKPIGPFSPSAKATRMRGASGFSGAGGRRDAGHGSAVEGLPPRGPRVTAQRIRRGAAVVSAEADVARALRHPTQRQQGADGAVVALGHGEDEGLDGEQGGQPWRVVLDDLWEQPVHDHG